MRKRIASLTLILVAVVVTACGGGAPTASISSSAPGSGSGGGATGTATLDWQAPTQNSDGTVLTDLNGYRIYQGTSASQSSLQSIATLTNASVSTYVVENLSPGTYYFAISAISAQNIESVLSNVVSITIN